MPNAKDYNPLDHGILCGVAGMSGKGKSSLIISMTEVGKTAVALTDPTELDLYGGNDIEYELFTDPKWQPLASKFVCGDFQRLITWLDKTSQRDDIRCIGIDHGSGGTTSPGVSELAMHDALEQHKTANPMDLAHGQAYFAHSNNMRYFLDACKLAAFRGKHVIVSFLVQLREDETSQSRDELLLPAVHGSIRQHIAASFSVWLHAYTIGVQTSTKYLVRAVPSQKQPAKSRLKFKNLQQATQLPNNLKSILGAL
jgi:hypothetical protein